MFVVGFTFNLFLITRTLLFVSKNEIICVLDLYRTISIVLCSCQINLRENRTGNQEWTLATLGTKHTGRKQIKQKTRFIKLIDEQHGLNQKNPEVNSGPREG